MTVPNKETARGRGAQRRTAGKRTKTELVGLLLLLCLAISILVSVRKPQEITDHHDTHVAQNDEHAMEFSIRKVEADPLEHEEIFSATIKSCLPEKNKHCKLFIPEHTTAQRIGVLAPPGNIEKAFLRLLEVVVGRARRKKKVDIELVSTTHIPPYGYGKTHGWTRIIRIVPQPLILGATSALIANMEVGQTLHSITVDDLRASLRQQIRYHCRASHVAAHTALWSIDLKTLFDLSIDDLIQQIQIFLGLEKDDFHDEIKESKHGAAEDGLVPPENMESLISAMSSNGASLLTHAQIALQGSILKELDDVLMEEMRISKNLTAWPCESLWTVGDRAKDPLEISRLVARIAQSMSPNCTAPFTSCFVKRDLCEAKGDGQCRGK